MIIQIKDILIKDRGRQLFHKIDKLAASIKKYGLLHPIVVAPTSSEEEQETGHPWKLVAGERRTRAHVHLKLEEINASLRENLSPILQKEIELEENLQREGMEWQEEVLMVESIHNLQKKIHRGSREKWTQRMTAESLGRSVGGVSDYLKLAFALREKVEEIISCRTISGALSKYSELREKAIMRSRAEKAAEEKKNEQRETENNKNETGSGESETSETNGAGDTNTDETHHNDI